MRKCSWYIVLQPKYTLSNIKYGAGDINESLTFGNICIIFFW